MLNLIAVTVSLMAVTGAVAGTSARQSDVTESFSADYQACITYGETHDRPAIPAAECNARELRAQDARLNAAYKAVMARLPASRKADLRTDERNWIVARDQQCGKLPDRDLTVECVIDRTIKRIGYLRRVK